MNSTILNIIRSEFSKLKIPHSSEKVYKDECVFSFDSPFSDTGLYVNLVTLQGVGQKYLNLDEFRTGSKLYLHLKWTQVPVENESKMDSKVPSKMAIGVDGGFITEEQYTIVKETSLLVISTSGNTFITLPNNQLPEFVSNICQAIIENEGMKSKLQLNAWEASSEIIVSKYAKDLPYVVSNKKISNDPKTWKCEASGDTNNIWLNLSTGYIGGGRKFWDGTGGSNAALDHYIATGKKYPLCVKLGTITSQGYY